MALEFEFLLHMLAPGNHAAREGDQIVATEIGRGILVGQRGHCHDKRTKSEQERHSIESSASCCAALNIITHHRDFYTDVTLFQKHRGLCSSIDVPHQHHRPIANANVNQEKQS